ncbi:MAG: glycosyltransferase, partial [Conexivisphaerales archaeon]
MNHWKFSVVVAVKNEAQNIGILVDKLLAIFKERKEKGEIMELIIVDDDSTDGTTKIVDQRKSFFTEAGFELKTVLRIGHNGTVGAQIEGSRYSESEFVIIMDGDLQHDPSLVPLMMDLVDENVDLIVASRFVNGGGQNLDLQRSIISKIARLMALIFIKNSRVCSDPLSGFFLCRRNLISKLDITENGFKLLLYVLATNKDLRIVEIPFVMGERKHGESKLTRSLKKLVF